MKILTHPFEILFVGSDKILINKGFVYDMSTLEKFDIPELSEEAWLSSPEPVSVSDGDIIYIKITKESPVYTDDPDLLLEETTEYYEDPPGQEVKRITKYYYDVGSIYGAALDVSSSEKVSDSSTIYVKIGEIVELESERIDQYVMSDIFIINDYFWNTRQIIEIDDSDSDSDSDSDDSSDSDSDSDGGTTTWDDSDSDSTGSDPISPMPPSFNLSSSNNSQYLTLF